jgi:hypothetical protein
LSDIWRHEEDEPERMQASPWQPDIVRFQPRADSQRQRRRRRMGGKRVPSLDVVVGTGEESRRNVIHFRDKVSSLGDAKSSLGAAKSSLGDAKSSLGDAKSSLGDAKSSLGDAKSSLGDAGRGAP